MATIPSSHLRPATITMLCLCLACFSTLGCGPEDGSGSSNRNNTSPSKDGGVTSTSAQDMGETDPDASTNEDGGRTDSGSTTMRDMDTSKVELKISIEGELWVNEPVVFDASKTLNPSQTNLTFMWDFEDGEEPKQGARVGHIFREPGTKKVTLFLKDQDQIKLTQEISIEAPTPQGVATLEGLVADEQGTPISGARLFDAQGQELGRTDELGQYSVMIPRGIPFVLHVRRAGWVAQLHRVTVPKDQSTWVLSSRMLRAQAAKLLIDAEAGGVVETDNGAQVTFPPQAFVNKAGEQVTGDLLVTVAAIDTSAQGIDTFPGGFEAIRLEDGTRDVLGSLGTMDVTLSQNDEQVFLAEGKKATIQIPLATEVQDGATIPLWSLDPKSGIWVSEGTGTAVSSNGSVTGRALQAEVSHFSWWNADVMFPTITQSFKLDQKLPTLLYSDVRSTEGRVRPRTHVTQVFPSNQDSVLVRLPVDEEVSSALTSEDGRYRSFLPKLKQGSNTTKEVARALTDLHTPDSTKRVWELGYGQDITVDVGEAGQEYYVGFEVDAGDLAQIEIQGDFAGIAGIIADTGYVRSERTWRANQEVRMIHPVPQTGRVTVLIKSFGQQTGKALIKLNKLPGEGFALGKTYPVTVDSPNQKEWLVRLNKGQILHGTMHGADVVAGSFSLDYFGQGVATRQISYGQNSTSFVAEKSGYHLLRWTPFSVPATPATFSLSLQEILPRIPITLKKAQNTKSKPITLESGMVVEYEVIARGNDAVLLEALPTKEEQGAKLQAQGFSLGLGGQSQLFTQTSKARQSVVLTRGNEDAQVVKSYMLGVSIEGGQAEVQTSFERLSPQEQPIKVGECSGVQTSQLTLAALAAQDKTAITLCPGTHKAFGGLKLEGKEVTIEGAGKDQTTIEVWDDAKLGGRGLVQLSKFTLDIDNVQGIELTYDRIAQASTPLKVEDVLIKKRTPSTRGTVGILLQGIGPENGPDNAVIKNVQIEGQYDKGVRTLSLSGVTLEDLQMPEVQGLGFEAFLCSEISIKEAQWAGLKQVIRATSDAKPLNISISGSSFETTTEASYGIELYEAQGGSINIEDSSLRHQGAKEALFLQFNGDDISFTTQRSKIECLASCTTVYSGPTNTQSNSKVRFSNNVILGAQTTIHILSTGTGGLFEIVNNSILGRDSSPTPNVILDLSVSAPDMSDRVYVENNILLGRGMLRDTAIRLAGIPSSLTTSNNMFNNMATLYFNGMNDNGPGVGDIVSTSPQLMDMTTLIPMPSSPAVNAGALTARTPKIDINKNARPTGGIVDIGAYEQ